MKNFNILLSVLLIIFLTILASCTMEPEVDSSGGSIYLNLAGATKGSEDTARIYLLTTDDELVSIGTDTDYRDVDLASGQTTVTILGIPAGPEYQVFFALGSQESGYFSTSRYAISNAFEVSPGIDVSVPKLALEDNPFTESSQLMGKNLKGVVVESGNIYTTSAGKLYHGTDVGSMTGSAALPGGHTANSISLGIVTGGAPTNVWVNTNRGILPLNVAGDAFDDDFTQNLGTVSVLESGAFSDSNDYIYFRSTGGLGGVEVAGEDPPDDWINVDLSDVISGQSVSDIIVADDLDQAYFATKLGTFALSFQMFTDGSEDFLDYATFIEVGPQNHPVISFDYDSSSLFVLGTEHGVWTSSDPPSGSALVSATRRYSFSKVTASSGNWAALGDHYLFVSIGGNLYTYPFHAGLPGDVTGMAFDGSTLVVSGTKGLVARTF